MYLFLLFFLYDTLRIHSLSEFIITVCFFFLSMLITITKEKKHFMSNYVVLSCKYIHI